VARAAEFPEVEEHLEFQRTETQTKSRTSHSDVKPIPVLYGSETWMIHTFTFLLILEVV